MSENLSAQIFTPAQLEKLADWRALNEFLGIPEPAPSPDAPTSQINPAPTDQAGYHDPARLAAWNAANPDVNPGSAPREDGHE